MTRQTIHDFQNGSCVDCGDPDTCASIRCAGTREGSLMSTLDEMDEAFAQRIEAGTIPATPLFVDKDFKCPRIEWPSRGPLSVTRVAFVPAPKSSLPPTLKLLADVAVGTALAIGTILYGGLVGFSDAWFGEDYGRAPYFDDL